MEHGEHPFRQERGIALAWAGAAGAFQLAEDAQTVRARFWNSADGVINVGADATARGFFAGAGSFAAGDHQEVHATYDPVGVARALSRNLGGINVWSGAKAHGSTIAHAFAGGVGLGQNISAFDAKGTAVNKGWLSVDATARAIVTPHPFVEAAKILPTDGAIAAATYVGGIAQSADGAGGGAHSDRPAFRRNSGDIYVSGVGRAVSSTYANAGANVFGIGQSAYGYRAYAEGQNTGSIYAGANTRARAHDVALAFSHAGAVVQRADSGFYNGSFDENGKSAKLKFDNSGWLAANAVAKAGYGSGTTYANALAGASGVLQYASDAQRLRTNFSNSGWIDASSRRVAKGDVAVAGADAAGYGASFESYGGASATARFRNAAGASIWSQAVAKAYGHQAAFANAQAVGAYFVAYNGVDTLTLNGVNAGYIGALAKATAVLTPIPSIFRLRPPRSRWRRRTVSSSAISTARSRARSQTPAPARSSRGPLPTRIPGLRWRSAFMTRRWRTPRTSSTRAASSPMPRGPMRWPPALRSTAPPAVAQDRQQWPGGRDQ